MEVGHQFQAPAALTLHTPKHPLNTRLGGPQGLSGRCASVLPCLDSNHHSSAAKPMTKSTYRLFSAGRFGPTDCCQLLLKPLLALSVVLPMVLTAENSGCSQVNVCINRLKPSGYLLYAPPGLTFNNPTFCPHSVFMCFVWISEQTAIISLYSINWPVFITETEYVYCAVRAESSYKITASLSPSKVMKD
jgi:hypothetical protein